MARFPATRTVATLVRPDEKLRAQPRASSGRGLVPQLCSLFAVGAEPAAPDAAGVAQSSTRLRSAALAIKKQKGQSRPDASTGCPPGVRTLDQRPAGSRFVLSRDCALVL